jgi:NADPH-dependent ferric siderophore reductase
VDLAGALGAPSSGLERAFLGNRRPRGPGGGHVYVAGERSVVQQTAVELERLGLQPAQVFAKAYWGMERPNATHGEPTAP